MASDTLNQLLASPAANAVGGVRPASSGSAGAKGAVARESVPGRSFAEELNTPAAPIQRSFPRTALRSEAPRADTIKPEPVKPDGAKVTAPVPQIAADDDSKLARLERPVREQISAAEGRPAKIERAERPDLTASAPTSDSGDQSDPVSKTNGKVALQSLKKAAQGNKQSIENAPVVAFLTGHLEKLQPEQIPDLVSGNKFLGDALLSGDVNDFLSKPMALSELVSDLDLPKQVLSDAQQLGVDLTQPMSVRELLRAIGVDPSRVAMELNSLKDTLTQSGVSGYVSKAGSSSPALPTADVQGATPALAKSATQLPTSPNVPGLGTVDPSVFGTGMPTAIGVGGKTFGPGSPSKGQGELSPLDVEKMSRQLSPEALLLLAQPMLGMNANAAALAGGALNERDDDKLNVPALTAAANSALSGTSALVQNSLTGVAAPEGSSAVNSELSQLLAKYSPEQLAQAAANPETLAAGTRNDLAVKTLAPELNKASFDAFASLGERLRAVDTVHVDMTETGNTTDPDADALTSIPATPAKINLPFLASLQKDIAAQNLPLTNGAAPQLKAIDANLQSLLQGANDDAKADVSPAPSTVSSQFAGKANLVRDLLAGNAAANATSAPLPRGFASGEQQARGIDPRLSQMLQVGNLANPDASASAAPQAAAPVVAGAPLLANLSGSASGLSLNGANAPTSGLSTERGAQRFAGLPLEDLRLAVPGLAVTGAEEGRGNQRDGGESGSRNDKNDKTGDDRGSSGNGKAEFGAENALRGLAGAHRAPAGLAHAGGSSFATHMGAAEGAMTTQQRVDIMQQVIDRATVIAKNGGGTVRLDLGSPEFGALEMAINMNNNRIDLHIMAGSDRVREAMMADLSQLKSALSVQNVQLGNVDVGVGHRQPQGGTNGGFNGFAGNAGQGNDNGRRFAGQQGDGNADRRAPNRAVLDAVSSLGRSAAPRGFMSPLSPAMTAAAFAGGSTYNNSGRIAVRA